jgi:transposase
MAARVRESHLVVTDDTVLPMLSPGKTQRARMWVYVGDASNPYNVFDFTLNRRRDGPKHFLKEYQQVLLADGYDGYNGVVAGNEITRSGCWSHARRKYVEAEKTAPEIAREAVTLVSALYAWKSRPRMFPWQSVGSCARRSRRQCWPSCGGSCCSGRSN